MGSFSVIIPARMHSTRLPRKMLLDVAGLPLIVRVVRQALQSKAVKVVVATDHAEIYAVCKSHQIDVVMTSETHQSGTDRLAEAVKLLGLADDEIVINVQGDEPLIDHNLINELAEFITTQKTPVATLGHPIMDVQELFNPNVVKIVLDSDSNAIYFSRATIPFDRDNYTANQVTKINADLLPIRHIGIYAYTVEFLHKYQNLAVTNLENIEKLEQLRVLYYGYKIAVLVKPSISSIGIDTAEDLDKVRKLLGCNND